MALAARRVEPDVYYLIGMLLRGLDENEPAVGYLTGDRSPVGPGRCPGERELLP